MQRGAKPKPAHLKLVEGTLRADRGSALEGAAVAPAGRPKFLKGRAAKIWDAMLEKHPKWTEFQIEVLATYVQLRADYEADPSGMATARMVEMRRQGELLLSPRGKVEEDAEADDPAKKYLG